MFPQQYFLVCIAVRDQKLGHFLHPAIADEMTVPRVSAVTNVECLTDHSFGTNRKYFSTTTFRTPRNRCVRSERKLFFLAY